MSRLGIHLVLCAVILTLAAGVSAEGTSAQQCATIQSGTVMTVDGFPTTMGYDEWGYNHQAHSFNGGYCDQYRGATWCAPYADWRILMKWNDAWLSNKDCDGDGQLDRHYGFPDYIGSGAWLTNHISGEYIGSYGEICSWDLFQKIVAAPAGAYLDWWTHTWYAADGTELGPEIWGSFIVVQLVSNDPCADERGLQFHSDVSPGLGHFAP